MPAPSRQSGLPHTRWRLFHHYWWRWTRRSRASLCWQVFWTLELDKLETWMKIKSDFVPSRYFLNGDFDSELPSLNTVRLDHACSSYYDHNDQLVSLFFHRPRFLYHFELQWHFATRFCLWRVALTIRPTGDTATLTQQSCSSRVKPIQKARKTQSYASSNLWPTKRCRV